jgi:hypothetical protein
MSRLSATVALGLTLVGVTACYLPTAAFAAPVINEIVPSSGPAGPAYPIQVTIRGSGFTSTGNVVTFGPVRLRELPSSDDGTAITVGVPKQMSSGGEVPPMVLPPGEYHVTVTNADGTSNAVTFSLMRAP